MFMKQTLSRLDLNSEPVLYASNLVKSFGRKIVLRGISLSVKRGEILGILGKNGTGKTVLLNILMGLIKPDRGQVHIFNLPLEQHLSLLHQYTNISFSSAHLQLQISLMDNLKLFAELYQITHMHNRTMALLKTFGLEKIAKENKKLYQLSSGELARASLCKAMLNEPDILFLDEPTARLDPLTKRIVIGIIKRYSANKKTCIVTLHDLSEAKYLCNRVVVLKNGSISHSGQAISASSMLRYY